MALVDLGFSVVVVGLLVVVVLDCEFWWVGLVTVALGWCAILFRCFCEFDFELRVMVVGAVGCLVGWGVGVCFGFALGGVCSLGGWFWL